ncbi:gag-pol polyprotein [Trifolium medium]|uniref:Gag-pol polyprotein n=1 Tax=Trifolium medium TaxID=97028 RepID=A0A392N822_9FABA|nr:gag-pol polyprotein [Trifolium medium]
MEVSLKFAFFSTINQTEYEACIARLNLELEMGARNLKLHTYSQLVVTQIRGEAQAKEPGMQKYLAVENLEKPSTNEKVVVCATTTAPAGKTWINFIKDYIFKGELPTTPSEVALIKRRVGNHTIIQDQLYRRGLFSPLLKCLAERETTSILEEVHEVIASQHLGGRALAKKILRAEYYWPSMVQESKSFVKKCEKCQKHGDVHIAPPPTELNSLITPWTFYRWRIDILRPFKTGPF